jgi:GrpB-like predicted nucleotidyltransferase (UPF0157 family)
MTSTLRLVAVGEEWAARFAHERSRIVEALGDSALDIQRVGSTAIPGITAKPIVDIAVAIGDFDSGCALAPSLVGLATLIAARTAFRGDITSSVMLERGSQRSSKSRACAEKAP